MTTILKMKAKKLATHPLFRSDSPEHIENDMWSNLWERCGRYMPDRGTRAAYASMLTDTWSATEIRWRKRQKRCHDYNSVSLANAVVIRKDKVIPLLEIAEARGGGMISADELMEVREALVVAFQSLTPQQRELLDDTHEMRVEAAATKRDVVASTIRRRLAAMRFIFEKAGFGNK